MKRKRLGWQNFRYLVKTVKGNFKKTHELIHLKDSKGRRLFTIDVRKGRLTIIPFKPMICEDDIESDTYTGHAYKYVR